MRPYRTLAAMRVRPDTGHSRSPILPLGTPHFFIGYGFALALPGSDAEPPVLSADANAEVGRARLWLEARES